ncbi:GTP pyrophosphokinase family protein [Providencia hangzhouensis]|uniref:GTP pyrophosphokinase n=1 Tax=Providencia hangzhouensis TaxID=3031799 RepID=UPI0034DD95EF
MSSLIEEFTEKKPLYTTLLSQALHSINSILDKTDIEIFPIEARLKDESSIKEKIQRKNSYETLSDIEDLCGLRIICYYESDLQKITDLIKDNFDVLSSSDKKQEADVEKFGYSSNHFIVKFKESWLDIPLYSNLGGLKFEIQVRTMLMHTWAAISHKTLYKNESDAPRHMRRTFSQLSALIELADEQFSRIKKMKDEYIHENKTESTGFKKLELNSDTLMMLINNHFPSREVTEGSIPSLLLDIKKYDSLVDEFEDRISKCTPYLESIEHELSLLVGLSTPIWTAEGICRIILNITVPEQLSKLENTNSPNVDDMYKMYKKYMDKINYTR